ncbi:MAG: dUTP diphosphatase [Treponema sp.]|nr:dUTP diphosphatase [Treponema sp.]
MTGIAVMTTGTKDRVVIKILKKPAAVIPAYETGGAAGMDLRALLPEAGLTLQPFERARVPTGLFLEIPQGFEGQIRPRSGLAARSGITVLNAPGTIDSDYRGEIEIILINLGSEPYTIRNSDRIAQLVIAPVLRADIMETQSLGETERGESGFGSTGMRG